MASELPERIRLVRRAQRDLDRISSTRACAPELVVLQPTEDSLFVTKGDET